MRAHPVFTALAGAMLCAGSLPAQLTTPLDSATLAGFRWRSIGPANIGGRVPDVEGVPGNSKVFYVATATGGNLEKIKARTMFFSLFCKEKGLFPGGIAPDPLNPPNP